MGADDQKELKETTDETKGIAKRKAPTQPSPPNAGDLQKPRKTPRTARPPFI